MLDGRARRTHPHARLTVAVASLIVLVLPFVTPVDGVRVSMDHAFQLVHPIFLHSHGHAHDQAGESAVDDTLAVPAVPAIAITSAGQMGAGVGVASESMLAAAALLVLLVRAALPLHLRYVRVRDQYLLSVPTGPPRRGSFI